jgi:hypothetical protein
MEHAYPLNKVMARISLWNSGKRGNDYKFTDRTISSFFGASGTAVYVHKYLGVYDQTANGIANAALMDGGVTSIQDPLFLENRDRSYDPTIIELRGIYNVADVDFDLRQFGLFLQNDTVFLEVHLNDMVSLVGRRVVVGDVIELPHQRDDTIPGKEDNVESPAINKFYVVDDAQRASDGYSSTWYPHIWRLKCTPLTASQEYSDILAQQTTDPLGLYDQGTLGDLLSTIATEEGINNAVVDAAMANFTNRNFETQQFWIMPGTELGNENPWIFAGDGIPPNGEGKPLQSGTNFPQDAAVGDFYLRLDYSPSTLFKKVTGGWQIQEVNYRQQEWTAAHRLLYDFINNNTTSNFKDGHTAPEKQALSTAVKARAGF